VLINIYRPVQGTDDLVPDGIDLLGNLSGVTRAKCPGRCLN